MHTFSEQHHLWPEHHECDPALLQGPQGGLFDTTAEAVAEHDKDPGGRQEEEAQGNFWS